MKIAQDCRCQSAFMSAADGLWVESAHRADPQLLAAAIYRRASSVTSSDRVLRCRLRAVHGACQIFAGGRGLCKVGLVCVSTIYRAALVHRGTAVRAYVGGAAARQHNHLRVLTLPCSDNERNCSGCERERGGAIGRLGLCANSGTCARET